MGDNIKIVCIPPDMLEPMWPHVVGFLLHRNLWDCGNLSDAVEAVRSTAGHVRNGHAQLWIATSTCPPAVMAVWVTALERDGSDLFLEIFSLCGRRMRSWFRPMDEAMAAFGSSEGCSAIRFPGRIGWSRLLPHYEAKGSPGPGSAYFERRLS